jgi:hypothetical protein
VGIEWGRSIGGSEYMLLVLVGLCVKVSNGYPLHG